MAVSVGTAYVSIIPSTKGFAKAVENDVKPAAMGHDMGKKSGKAYSKGFGASLGGMKAAIAGAGFAVAGAAVAKFASQSVQAFRDVAAESTGLQRVLGGTIEEMSTLRGAAQLGGVSTEAMGVGMKMLSKQIYSGGKELKKLGIATTDATGKLRPTNDVLMDVADRFKEMPNGAAKTALALKLFGRTGGTEMLPMLNRGSEGIAELEKQTAKYGMTLTKVDQENIKKFVAAQRELKMASEGAKVGLGKALMPALTKIEQSLVKILPPLVQALTPALKAFGDIAVMAVNDVATNMPAIQKGAKDFAVKLREGGQWIKVHWPEIRETIHSISTALERAGKWVGFLWDKFNQLPPEVKTMIAMLAIAQKTGVLGLVFKGFDFLKSMMVSAGVVNIVGGKGGAPVPVTPGGKGTPAVPVPGGTPKPAVKPKIPGSVKAGGVGALVAGLVAAMSGGDWKSIMGSAVAGGVITWALSAAMTAIAGLGVATLAPVLAVIAAAAGAVWLNSKNPYMETPSGSNQAAPTPNITPPEVKARIDQHAALVAIIRDETRAYADRKRALDQDAADAVSRIRTLQAQGVSTERVAAASGELRRQLFDEAKQLGMTDDQAAKYAGRLRMIPRNVPTKATVDTSQATAAVDDLFERLKRLGKLRGTVAGGVLPISISGTAQGLASGGMIPGTGTRDTTPVLTTPGEWVLTRRQVAQVSPARLEAWRQGGPPPGAGSGVQVGQLIINNPRPESASDSLPRSIRKLQHVSAR